MRQTLQPHGTGRAALQVTGSGPKGSATTAAWRSPTSASKSSSSKSTGNRRRPESAEINDERRPAAAHPGRLLRIWMNSSTSLGLLLPPVVGCHPEERNVLRMCELVGIGDPLLACIEQRNDIEARQQNAVVSSHGIVEFLVSLGCDHGRNHRVDRG